MLILERFFGFSLDFGLISVIPMLIVSLVATFGFPVVTINDAFGIRHREVMESEEIWHKVHVRASICTIPFNILFVVCIFVRSRTLKILFSIILMTLMIIVWNLVAHFCTKDQTKLKKEIERKQLEEEIKKESGWR